MSNERTASAWKLVPVETTDEIAEAIAGVVNVCGGIADSIWTAAVSASPEPPALNWRPDREAVAREIDPEAFSASYITLTSTVADHQKMNRRAKAALAKADRILALPSQPQTGGEG